MPSEAVLLVDGATYFLRPGEHLTLTVESVVTEGGYAKEGMVAVHREVVVQLVEVRDA